MNSEAHGSEPCREGVLVCPVDSLGALLNSIAAALVPPVTYRIRPIPECVIRL